MTRAGYMLHAIGFVACLACVAGFVTGDPLACVGGIVTLGASIALVRRGEGVASIVRRVFRD